MIAAPAIKGWCPSLLSPMESGDGWLARVKPRARALSAEAARLIADAARRHGNGHIDLTSRANLQVRGLSPRSAQAFAETVIAADLANANSSLEAVRNVMVSPLGPDDPSAAFDSHAMARDLEAMLAREPALWVLPSKFGVLVDGGGVLPLVDITADIMARAHDGKIAVSLDGGTLAAPSPPAMIAETVKALSLAFLHLSAQRSEKPRRMRALVMAAGEQAVFAKAGLPVLRSVERLKSVTKYIGLISLKYRSRAAFGVGLTFGRIEAEALAHLADLSERFGDATLRATPWRALLLPGIAASDATRLATEVEALGLIANASDPRLNIFACVGAPSCQRASVDARGDAGRLAATIVDATHNETLHVSGCAKSCAHRGASSLTLVGRDGCYDLIRNGSAAGRPSLAGLTIDQIDSLLQSAKGQRP